MSGPGDETAHILVVDDDTRIRGLLKTYLSDHALRVSGAASAAEARARMQSISFDLVVLDIMMPGESGLDLARSLRTTNNDVPILFLSALAEADERIAGLAAGGDDYLTKPFEPEELLLRVQNILRRHGNWREAVTQVQFGGFEFDLVRGELHYGEEIVRLTTRECDILRLLARNAGTPVERSALLSKGSDESARGVDVQINRIRRKIEENPSRPVNLQTVRGRGYILHVD